MTYSSGSASAVFESDCARGKVCRILIQDHAFLTVATNYCGVYEHLEASQAGATKNQEYQDGMAQWLARTLILMPPTVTHATIGQ